MSEVLAARIAAIQTQIAEAHTEAHALARLVGTVDADRLDFETEKSLREVLDSLAAAGRMLSGADGPLAVAVYHARLLP